MATFWGAIHPKAFSLILAFRITHADLDALMENKMENSSEKKIRFNKMEKQNDRWSIIVIF